VCFYFQKKIYLVRVTRLYAFKYLRSKYSTHSVCMCVCEIELKSDFESLRRARSSLQYTKDFKRIFITHADTVQCTPIPLCSNIMESKSVLIKTKKGCLSTYIYIHNIFVYLYIPIPRCIVVHRALYIRIILICTFTYRYVVNANIP